MNKKYAVFDMDGTLVDSMGCWVNLWREYLCLKGVEPVPDDMLPRIKAMTMTESAALFIQEFAIAGTPESVAKEMNDLMGEHYKQDIPLKPGIKGYLDRLNGMGVRMCVVSATAEYLVKECLSRCGIDKYFDFVLSCEETGLGKHMPDIYLMAAQRLGAKPRDTAVYEDALYAARTAKAAGFYLIGVKDDAISRNWEEICAISHETVTDWQKSAEDIRA